MLARVFYQSWLLVWSLWHITKKYPRSSAILRFYTARKKLHSLAKVNLVGELTNDKDPNAISVFLGEQQLGFIERNVAIHLAVVMDMYPRLKVIG